MKVVPQASNCREIEFGGAVFGRSRGGLFDMPDAVAKHVIKYEGGQEPALSGHAHRRDGYRCLSCDFGSFFKKCSRCGGECEREVAN